MKVIDHPGRSDEKVIVVEEGDTYEEMKARMCMKGATFPIPGEGECVHYQFPCHKSPRSSLVSAMDQGWFDFYMNKRAEAQSA